MKRELCIGLVDNFSLRFAETPTQISPKENSGASGGFLPNPLLLRLRLPNSKKISRVFCEILSPKNSFRKTESALISPPRLCEAVAGLIHSFSFRSKKIRAKCIITAPVVTCSELGAHSSLVERVIDIDEVVGSIPTGPTKLPKPKPRYNGALVWVCRGSESN